MAVTSATVLGSTGSVGTRTVELLAARPEIRVQALVARRSADRLATQARTLDAAWAVLEDPGEARALESALAGTRTRVAAGSDAVLAAAGLPADWTMAAIAGLAGLAPTLAAIRRGGTVAIANKEPLVAAGDLVLAAARHAGATLLPVDSEHNAIFQALEARNRDQVVRLEITASGGPCRLMTDAELRAVTPAIAVRHPVWPMGAKISVDSATLMNKGLEVIEAARLFGFDAAAIGVLVHPQAVVHGLVHYADGSVLAQLACPDMLVPIAHCLAWPDRMPTRAARLDLAALGRLDFLPPDTSRFPALKLAYAALRAGAGAPTVLNAANEAAVAAFLAGRCGFLAIADAVSAALDALGAPPTVGLDDVMALDAAARRHATMALGLTA